MDNIKYLMKALMFLIQLLGVTNTESIFKITCDGIIFNHVYYDKKFIVGNYGRPYNLMYHTYAGNLYFSHTVRQGSDIDFIITWCNLEKKTCSDIKDVPGGYAIAYDAGNDDIYIGGHDGIYKFNFLNKRAEPFSERGKSIWGLFIRKNFYYIEYPTQKLHVYAGDKFVQVLEARNMEIDQFFVSKVGDVYFSNKTGLFKVIRMGKEVILMDDTLIVRQIAEDHFGDIYFCGDDGIYIEEKPYETLEKVADIEHAYGLAFDRFDHLIYSDKDSIYKLEPSKNAQICYNALKSHRETEFRKNFIQ